MAIETFTWRTQIQDGMEGSFTQRVRVTVFGDGFKQVTGDGINPESQTWPISMSGREKELIPALNFLRQHAVKAFIWTPPYGGTGLYRVAADSIRASPIGCEVMTIKATFEQA
ncbi:phage tail protein [Pantoea coffeiphila]|uniref:Phage tail protein n=1 Tax=Pantoea coffeiphila TaxID=1465635 RepID=A0A2S9I863_9GAMM|nr:phage tail protein [Pantoea coffeiphila]PRD13971.1 phage tail protein [Pantoea coffeiphila]